MTRRSLVLLNIILLAGMSLASTNALAQANMVCGLDVYPSPIGFPEPDPEAVASQLQSADVEGDPCLDGSTVFGPTRYERTNGKPQQVISEFTLEAEAKVCVIAKAGAKGKASLFVDGVNIAEPEDFETQLHTYVDILAGGSHGLGVRAVGKPGSYLDIEILQLESGGGGGNPDIPAPGEIRIDPGSGAVDMVSADGNVRLQNVAADHPLLTPNGDGHHDTTLFQALTTPLVPLPGKDDGSVDYFVNWEFQVTDLFTCNTIDTGLVGSEQINSPTLVTTNWDGLDSDFVPYPSGNYAYHFNGNVVNDVGDLLGSITSPSFGFAIDSSPASVDYIESAEGFWLPQCDTGTDPNACRCIDSDGEPVPDCAFSFVSNLVPGGTFPFGSTPNYYGVGALGTDLDLSFITTTLDPVTGRYTVTVDLREQNAGGLVPKGQALWSNEDNLRQWVSNMTGVPVSTGDSLFNFDYIQIGTSTGVRIGGLTINSFNHFLLDAMTDQFGTIFLGGSTTNDRIDLNGPGTFAYPEIYPSGSGGFNEDNSPPPQFIVAGDTVRAGDECTNSGNTDGTNDLRGKFCAYNTAVKIGNTTDLGIYLLRTTMFDLSFNNELTTQDELCGIFGFYQCGVRTQAVLADTLEIESLYYDDGVSEPVFTRTITTQFVDAAGASVSVDRGTGEDGVCSRAVAVRDGLAVRMDAADGSVPDSCIINGIF